LKRCGLATKKMMKTKAQRTLIPSITKEAYFTEDGRIFVPIWQSRKRCVRDMIRHEYGHALLYHYPTISQSKKFQDTFCNSSDRDDYVTQYAMRDPIEDFCETFMLYMKYKGLPRTHLSENLKKKWDFIASLWKRFHRAS
jgi:hypothetical protein